MTKTHAGTVAGQFGPQADAYVASAVHAAGADLDRIAAIAAEVGAAAPHAWALDLGCGGGHVAYRMAGEIGKVVAYDLSAEMLAAVAATAAERGLANIMTEQGAAERLPFADGAFALVASRYSAHHWGDLDAALREARRVAVPGGRVVFADVVSPGRPLADTWLQALELLRDPSHGRNLALAEWVAALDRAGLAVTRATTGRLRLDFPTWIARMRTPPAHVAAIESLMDAAPAEVRRHFAFEADRSFTIDTAVIEARA